MSALHLHRHGDGALGLYLDGDLQFDSRDERIYHECMVLPALALALERCVGPLRALVCGGGDGLAAREVLKSSRVAHLDLVDYDPEVVGLARTELGGLNAHAFDDPRLLVHHADARTFLANAAPGAYDLVICDLTVPQEVEGASLHAIEWYAAVARALASAGVLVANACSPSATPEAYWSIYNGMRSAGLQTRPFRFWLPSFKAQGYGPDWGMVMAAHTPIPASAIAAMVLAEPRSALVDAAQFARLFRFPAAVAQGRGSARPFHAGSAFLLHALARVDGAPDNDTDWDALAFEVDPAPLPLAARPDGLLPASLREGLQGIDHDVTPEAVLEQVLALVPSLQRFQTRDMITAFLAAPARFLASIDLAGLVERLLARAAELPERLVAELRLLREHASELLGDRQALVRLGLRVVSVIAVVVALGNLVHPDSAYGKGAGGHAGYGSYHTSSGFHYYGWSTVHTTGSVPSDSRPHLATNAAFRDPGYGSTVAADELGTPYAARSYVFAGRGGPMAGGDDARHSLRPGEQVGLYRVAPDVDLLTDGRLVVDLGGQAFLDVAHAASVVVDRATGEPLAALKTRQLTAHQLDIELGRQRQGLSWTLGRKQRWNHWVAWLDFMPLHDQDVREARNVDRTISLMDRAHTALGQVPAADRPAPGVPGTVELFAGVWLLGNERGIALQLADGSSAVLGTNGQWYADTAMQRPLAMPHALRLRGVLVDYLGQVSREGAATRTALERDLGAARRELLVLERDGAEYTAILRRQGGSYQVDYGSVQLPVSQALARTDIDVGQAHLSVAALERAVTDWASERALASRLYAAMAGLPR